MSHSITTTASYVLSKYSRSHPSMSAAESEWQHFTNPVMRITLEARKSPLGQLVSMRLRILWNLHSESDDLHTDQREVVLEDLELLSFSSLPAFQASAALQSDQGLPLKAVYRDAVVGIRYLHPRMILPTGSQPASYHTYRRFQVTFKDALDASRLIDAIKSVCPCKANPRPALINRHSTMFPNSLGVSSAVSAQSIRLTERQTNPSTTINPWSVPSTMLGYSSENQAFPVAPSSMATSLSSDDSAFVTCSETSFRADTQGDPGSWKDGVPKSHGHDSAQSSLPNSSQASSDQGISMPPPPVPRRPTHSAGVMSQEQPGMVNVGDEKSQFLASLSEHPTLYELSRGELETLVSQVIREDGFIHLLESLDSLWKVKGFLGR